MNGALHVANSRNLDMAVSIWFGLQLMGRLRLMLDAGYRPIAIPALIAFEAQRLQPLGRDAVIIHQYTRPDCGPSASQWPPGRIGHSLSPCKSSNAEPIARRSRVMGRSSFVELACCCANDKANGGAIAIMSENEKSPASRVRRNGCWPAPRAFPARDPQVGCAVSLRETSRPQRQPPSCSE